jgi:hypothetical protein
MAVHGRSGVAARPAMSGNSETGEGAIVDDRTQSPKRAGA